MNMNFINTIKTKLVLTTIFGMIVSSSLTLEAKSVAIPVGPPIRISPIPSPVNPDPILQNLQAVMDDFFQPPYYPGFPPSPPFPNSDYLGGIYYQSDVYVENNRLKINPIDDRIMHISFGQNWITDFTQTFRPMIGSNTFATSVDGGLSWSYGPPIQQIIPLGGTLSQYVNQSLGPGFRFFYNKEGKLFAHGDGDDFHPNPPNQVPLTRFVVTSSEDEGKTWTAPVNIFHQNPPIPTPVDWWFTNATGLGWWDFYVTADPSNENLLHGITISNLFPDNKWGGQVYYFNSKNGAKSFSSPRLVYSMIDDPVWQEKYFNPDFTSDPNYFIFGGVGYLASLPLIVDENVILLPFVRIYPRKGFTTYNPYFSYVDTRYDIAVVRSFDHGKTWSKIAGATDEYNAIPGSHDPAFVPTSEDPFVSVITPSSGQNCTPVVSPFTGRIYFAVDAGNLAADPDPTVCNVFPHTLLAASSDKGETWTSWVQVNATPKNISFARQQAFGHSMTMTLDGHVVILYYDFRNWTGTPGENVHTTPLQTDAWIAIYRETDDPRGGSTGVGLDFVEEIRLTAESFNGRYGSLTPVKSVAGTVEGSFLAVNSKNELFAIYSTTNKPTPTKITNVNTYKGMTIDTNSIYNILLQKFQFPKPSNQ